MLNIKILSLKSLYTSMFFKNKENTLFIYDIKYWCQAGNKDNIFFFKKLKFQYFLLNEILVWFFYYDSYILDTILFIF